MAGASAMDRAFDSVESSAQALAENIHSSLVLMKLTAEDVERATKDCEEVKRIDKAVLELIGTAEEMDRHINAVRTVKERYQLDPSRPTDFEQMCQEEMEKLPVGVATENRFYQQFKEAIWNVHNAGVPMPGQEQADIMCTTQAPIVNKTCPVSGKPVTELLNPVRCTECRHIYDHEAVLLYIGRRREQKCAVAGCPRMISQQNLKCDATLRIEIEELRLRGEGGHNTLAESHDILELDD